MCPAPSDLFLSPHLTTAQAEDYLASLGFHDPAAAERNLRTMAEEIEVREALGRMADALVPALTGAPSPDQALVGFSRYLAARMARGAFLDYLSDDPVALQVLVEVLGTSPFLSEILIRNPEYLYSVVAEIDRGRLGPAPPPAPGERQASLDSLKRFKRRELLRIAARDILGREDVESATAQLSDLASVLIDRAVEVAMAGLLGRQGLDEPPGAFAVIGMGKLGGRELNYSSDIDLIYVYDPEDDDRRAHDFFHRLARDLTSALGEHTNESYLYRVDLRLRPMAGRGNIAYSLAECERYYERWGETFERLALIRARPVAGDRAVGRRFVEQVRPFVYRPYPDYAAIEELHAYKLRTDRALGAAGGERNVKLGRGGIREVELFTQAHQLMHGGRRAEIQVPNTLLALDRLRDAGLVSDEDWGELRTAYPLLRSVEHRLQIVHESQTHSLSREALELEITARRLGFPSAAAMEATLDARRERVHQIYSGVMAGAHGPEEVSSRRVFRLLAGEGGQDALAHLAALGFQDAPAALGAMRALEEYAAPTRARSAARNLAANLVGGCLGRIARSDRPDAVLTRLERLGAAAGSAVSLYRTLIEDDAMRDLLLTVLDSGELLSERIIRHPALVDALAALCRPRTVPAGPDHAGRVDVDALETAFTAGLRTLRRTERMDEVRRFKLATEFTILVEWLAGGAFDAVQQKLSELADACIEHAAHWGTVEVPVAAGSDDREWAIVALGKLGGRELAVHSDLDLVVFYDGAPTDSRTFVLFQSFVEAVQAFLEAPTSEAAAYHIDTRLRPEGTKGALAMPLVAFRRYLAERAEAWERLAWTRFRVVVGAPRITRDLHELVEAFVYGPWSPAIVSAMRHIRTRMERELAREGTGRIDVKAGRGGLSDIDFLLELVQIREGERRSEFRVAGTRALLAALPPTGYVTGPEAACLREAHRFLRTLEMVVRMDGDASLSAIDPKPALLRSIEARLRLAGAPCDDLLATHRRTADEVRAIYEAVMTRL